MRKWTLIFINCLFISFASSLISCLKEADLPLVKTTEVTNIKTESGLSGGTVIYDGGAKINVTGICWGTEDNPTIAGYLSVSDKPGDTKFDCLLFGLNPNTHYHVRAFAKNRVGTSYGNEVHFKTLPAIANVTTVTVSQIGFRSAIVVGKVECAEESIVHEKGFCWSTRENPTIENTHISYGKGSGRYIGWILGIQSATIYHVRAYVIGGSGITYGEDISFKTLDDPAIATTVKEVTRTSASIEGEIISYENYPPSLIYGLGMGWEWGFFYGIVPDPVNQGNYCGIWDYYSEYGEFPLIDAHGVFTFTFHNLTPCTTYYFTAFVYIDDIYYGNEVSFTTDK